jgi:DNA repair exonuclease SbcCD ATPase subunit
MILLERLRADRFKGLRDVDLAFPARGSILVEGLNEAGKSTLFESVYFALYGALLASEDNRGGLESAIGYGADEATVELAFRVAATRLVVTRTIRRQRPSRARLRLWLADGSAEEVGQIAAVNRRIVQELGNLEGAALLDSCFVEQKKLEKLEAMDAREREAALLRLLNLDRLSALGLRFRPGRPEERALAAAERRAELARLRELIPARAAEEAAATRAIRAAALRRALDALAAHEAAAEAAAQERARWETARAVPRDMALGEAERALLHEWAETTAQAAEVRTAEQTAAAARAEQAGWDTTATHALRRLGWTSALAALLLAGGGAAAALGYGPLAIGLALLAVIAVVAAGAAGRRWVGARAAARGAEAAAAEASAAARDGAQLATRLGVERALGEAAARERRAREDAASSRAVVLAVLAQLDLAPPAELSVAAVARLLPAVADAPDAADVLLARRDELLGELGALRRQAETLERELGLADTPLDRAACEAEAAALRRELAVAARALGILATARDRLVQRVLPNTVRHMQLLLPLLTDGRYRDATITDDYRIRVWDERARRYVAKHLFSGGTRDQFSLALRLAFALATLPAERGARAGFLFLDEPLSSFDAPRSRALVELLTNGYVAAHFAQVFVISHGGAFDRHAFGYTLRLAHGRVVESNLPAPGEAPWPATAGGPDRAPAASPSLPPSPVGKGG